MVGTGYEGWHYPVLLLRLGKSTQGVAVQPLPSPPKYWSCASGSCLHTFFVRRACLPPFLNIASRVEKKMHFSIFAKMRNFIQTLSLFLRTFLRKWPNSLCFQLIFHSDAHICSCVAHFFVKIFANNNLAKIMFYHQTISLKCYLSTYCWQALLFVRNLRKKNVKFSRKFSSFSCIFCKHFFKQSFAELRKRSFVPPPPPYNF